MIPVQLLVIGQVRPDDTLAAALDGLREGAGVRLLDYQAVHKDVDGDVVFVPCDELRLPCAPAGGSMVRALLGTGRSVPDPRRYLTDGDWYWFLDDHIPPATTALLLLVEHLWAAPLARALSVRGAALLHDAWIHPGDLGRAKTTRNG